MNRRQGKFTLADLAGTAVLVLALAATWPALTDAIAASLDGANPLTGAAIVILIPTIIFSVLASIIVRSGPTEPADTQPPRRRGRR